MVVGDRQKYLCMLITLKTIPDCNGEPTDRLSDEAEAAGRGAGSMATTVSEAINCPHWREYIDECIAIGNLKATSNAQIIQKYHILPVDFSIKNDTLTPTLKIKRKVVLAKYAKIIRSFYK